MNERGFSNFVYTLLIFLLIISSVVVLWNFIFSSLNESGSELNVDTIKVSLRIVPSSVAVNEQAERVVLNVQRETGGGFIAGFNLVLKDGKGNAFVYELRENIDVFGIKNLDVNYGSSDLESLERIEVVPVLIAKSGEEQIGLVSDFYEVNDNFVEESEASCIDGLLNGNETDVDCGGNCPDCDVGEICFVNEDCLSDYCNGTCQIIMVECNDGIDNDGDGSVDLSDGGCLSSSDDDESNCGDNVCETAENCPIDSVGCSDNACFEPTCDNGCGEVQLIDLIDESCFGNFGCGYQECSCSGYGDECALNTRTIFVSDNIWDGNLGGLIGADEKCQQSATDAGLPGNWKAWLSNSTTSASSRLIHSNSFYTRTDGATVANNWADLTDGNLVNLIVKNEFGLSLTGGSQAVWTATNYNGSSNLNNCANWNVNAGLGRFGTYTSNSPGWWTSSGTQSCAFTNRLYCVEQ